MLRALLLSAGAAAAGLQVLHARRNWGATDAEVAAVLPGDDLVPEPAEQLTMAVPVDAPPEAVWAWLVQIGQDRGGMYSYDRLENLIGLRIHSADEIREEWQHLAEGDRVVVVPRGYGPMPDGYAFTVARVDPPRALVLRQAPPEHPWNGVWSFSVVPDGAGGCRLLSRARTEVPRQAGLRVATRIGEPVTLVMTRRMLHGIKERAERRGAPAAS
ncbi:SRPBCC family protein [Blastococcus sp. TF02A-30]|uniref:SRPBCC family protein n=1 Tax=Blastococcus sp. TF02A-30 TaxID=2250580 RepID=UPI000DE931E4|nr:SRPBCC family protein [Blastococcus sp. TF02A-30]RBY87755.1 SRPBCC family protein [Blastococcus sp. TF02A-30]